MISDSTMTGEVLMFNAEKLKRLKKERNMTTETLSARSGVPVGTLNKILSGSTVSPRSSTMEALEKVLCDPVPAIWKDSTAP